MPILTSLKARLHVVRNLFRFFAANRLWWMIPMFAVLLAFFGIVILGQSTPLGPFIYTVF